MSFNNMDTDKRVRKIEDSITFLKAVMRDFYTLWGYPAVFTAIQTILPELEAKHNSKTDEGPVISGEFKGK